MSRVLTLGSIGERVHKTQSTTHSIVCAQANADAKLCFTDWLFYQRKPNSSISITTNNSIGSSISSSHSPPNCSSNTPMCHLCFEFISIFISFAILVKLPLWRSVQHMVPMVLVYQHFNKVPIGTIYKARSDLAPGRQIWRWPCFWQRRLIHIIVWWCIIILHITMSTTRYEATIRFRVLRKSCVLRGHLWTTTTLYRSNIFFCWLAGWLAGWCAGAPLASTSVDLHCNHVNCRHPS